MSTTAPHGPASGLPARRRQRVRVPWRIAGDPAYDAGALSVYVKVAALGQRPEGCTARVATLAGYLAMSTRAVERGITQLHHPHGDGEVTEMFTRRRTLPGGRGDSAHRTVRQLAPGELYVWLPVAAADALTPRLLRLYAAIAYATARRLPVTAAELGALLGVTERRARDLVAELERLGWITVHRRGGVGGRHAYDVHEHPLQPALPAPPAAPETGGGSGPEDHGGSLASKEDQELTDPEKAQVVVPSRRRRRPVVARGPVDNPPVPAALCAPVRRSAPPAYAGPPLQLSARVWAVLEPARDLLPGIRPWLLRRAARDVGAQLRRGTAPELISARIRDRRARLDSGRPTDPGAWLLHVAIQPWGCGLDGCEEGRLHRPWAPGPPIPCPACNEHAAAAQGELPAADPHLTTA